MADGVMVWLPLLERPAEKRFEEVVRQNGLYERGDLQTLAAKCKKVAGHSPWIKMSTGAGSAFFDDHCIRALQQAFKLPVTI